MIDVQVSTLWVDISAWCAVNFTMYLPQGFHQIGKALDMLVEAMLTGVLLLSFFASHCSVTVTRLDTILLFIFLLHNAQFYLPGTMWTEPALLWVTICMPTGSGKSPLYSFLRQLISTVRKTLGFNNNHPIWVLVEASFGKMGELMAGKNNWHI